MTLDAFDVGVPIEIRDLTEADLDAPAYWPYHVWWWKREWSRAINGDVRLLVATANGHLIGRVAAELERHRDARAGELRAFDVLEPFRGAGIGGRMVGVVERIFTEVGLHASLLASYKDNPRVTAWYERLGYAVVGEELDEWDEPLPDGGTRHHADACWSMRKVL